MLKEEAKERYRGIYYSALEWEEKYPDGESPKLFYERVSSAWKNFKNDVNMLSGNALLVTHGGVINIILCCENGIEYTNKYLNYSIKNAEIISV